MSLIDNPDFYLGALMAFGGILAFGLFAAFGFSRPRHLRERMLNPAVLFLAPYLVFLGLSFTRPFFEIDYVPSVDPGIYATWAASQYTVALYLLGGLCFFAGFAAFPATARRYRSVWEVSVRQLFSGLKASLRGRKVTFFLYGILIVWAIGLAANMLLFIQVRGVPLFDINKRELMDPKLTFVAEFEPLLVLAAPYAFQLREAVPQNLRRVFQPKVYLSLVVVSTSLLALFGARNLPAKMALAVFLVWILAPRRQHASERNTKASERLRRVLSSSNARFVVFLGVVLLVAVGVAGAFTKIEIYRLSPDRLPGTVLGASVADSIGNLYSFNKLTQFAGLFGYYHGDLLRTTYLSYIPGRDEVYANIIVGEVIGYSPESLISISSTFNGPALLDFGVLGLMLNSGIYGFLLAYGWAATKRNPRNLGVLAFFLTTLILDIHLGTYNLWSFFSIAILILVVEFNELP